MTEMTPLQHRAKYPALTAKLINLPPAEGVWRAFDPSPYTVQAVLDLVPHMMGRYEAKVEDGVLMLMKRAEAVAPPAEPKEVTSVSGRINAMEAGETLLLPDANFASVRTMVFNQPRSKRMICYRGKGDDVYVQRVREPRPDQDQLIEPLVDAMGDPIYLREDGRRMKYPYHLLKVGDSFTLSGDYNLFTSANARCQTINKNLKAKNQELRATYSSDAQTITVKMHALGTLPPLPPKGQRRVFETRVAFPFGNMKPGDSFTVPTPTDQIRASLHQQVQNPTTAHRTRKFVAFDAPDLSSTTVHCVPYTATTEQMEALREQGAPKPVVEQAPALQWVPTTIAARVHAMLDLLPTGFAVRTLVPSPEDAQAFEDVVQTMVDDGHKLTTKRSPDGKAMIIERSAE